jgi:hypothetical protein
MNISQIIAPFSETITGLEYNSTTGVLSLTSGYVIPTTASTFLPIGGGTLTGNLLFTDATYDIGASGATRPRDLFLSRNLAMGGTLTNTMAATDTLGIIVDGATNAFSWDAVANFTINNFTRTYNTGTLTKSPPSLGYLHKRGLTWDADFSGTSQQWSTARQLYVASDVLVYSADIAITSVGTPGTNMIMSNVGSSGANAYSGSFSNSTTKSFTANIFGASYSCDNTGTYTVTGSGVCTFSFYGGRFINGVATPTVVSGTPVFNYYGGYFAGLGSTAGTSTVYGGYFTSSGGDTNYDIYAANAASYNRFQGNVGIGKDPTVPLDVVGAILNTTTIEAGTGFKCGGTAAVADGTYTVGARLTPVTGTDGTITVKGGIVTAIVAAT